MGEMEFDSPNEDVFEEPSAKRRKANRQQKRTQTKKGKKELYKPPTVEELNKLKETENLFNSNLFRLQIEELLAEVKIKEKVVKNFENWYRSFEIFVSDLEEYEDVVISGQSHESVMKRKRLDKFRDDLLGLCLKEKITCDENPKLKFLKPSGIKLIGLSGIDCAIGPNLEVRINLKMPKSCFHEKDYLNNRYFFKRYYYLLYIWRGLQDSNLCSKISVSYETNKLLPILLLTPNNSQKIQIRLYLSPTKGTFPLTRCLPSKNNMKKSLFEDFHQTEEELSKHPTPFYNSLLLHDFSMSSISTTIKNTLNDHKNIKDGIKLILVWSRQRQLGNNYFGLTEDLIANIMVYLVQKRKVTRAMSAYQVIRNFWVFLVATDWRTSPISLGGDVDAEFKKSFDVVFLDGSGICNLAAFMSCELYLRVKEEAAMAVKGLDEGKLSSFSGLFVTKVPFCLQFDAVIKFFVSEDSERLIKGASVEDQCKFIGCSDLLEVKVITEKLKYGLNKRVKQIVPFVSTEEVTNNSISFGVSLDIENAFKILEMGPNPHDPKAKEFLQFWGNLSKLRRFPDGTVCEAVHFNCETIQDRREIVKKILTFVAKQKLKLKHRIWFDQFEEVLKIKNFHASFPTGTNEEASLKVIKISDELSQILRGLKLPLEIVSVSGNDDVFSFTEVFPAIPTNHNWKSCLMKKGVNFTIKEDCKKCPPFVPVIEGVLHLGVNSKWPNDLEAMRNIKTAFYLKITEILQKKHQINTNVRPEHFDIFYSGLLFRYKLYHPREVTALKKSITTEGLTTYKETEESLNIEKELNIHPKIISALRGLQSQSPSFGPSTALIKRWLRSHLIDGAHFPDVVVNLLNASEFLKNGPFTASNLPQIAFIRFLKFVSESDFNLQYVVVNFNDEFTRERLDEIELSFAQNRVSYPSLYVVTPYDEGKSIFSKIAPTKEVLRRVAFLAGESLKIIYADFEKNFLSDIKLLFTPNLKGYDIIIRLNHCFNPRRRQNLAVKHQKEIHLEEYNDKKNFSIPVVDFDPVQIYLKELRKHYGQHALFFHDTFGGDLIGVLWTPKAKETREFAASQIDGCKLVDGKLVPNKEAIIEDFKILGKNLVQLIEVK